MRLERTFDTKKRIHPYDGYQSESVWQQPENYSTHYSYQLDRQCQVPIRDIEELKKELGI